MRLHVLATGSRGNCYVLHDNGACLLLDAGIEAGKIFSGLGQGSNSIMGALITHKHLDHCKAVEELFRRGITSYGSVKAAGGLPWVRTSSGAHRIGWFTCLPFPVTHCDPDGADCPNAGWVIDNVNTKERMVYITDFCAMENTIPKVNYWLIECNYMDDMLEGTHPALASRLPKSHMSLAKLIKVFQANDLTHCKQIVLCHGSRDRLDPEQAQKVVMEATGKPTVVAKAGLSLPLELEPY